MNKIQYQGGYKYQLHRTYVHDLPKEFRLHIKESFTSDFLDLTVSGILTIRSGYAWDGPSGPTIDTKNFMRGSLVHDALYQLLREQHFGTVFDEGPRESVRLLADRLLRSIVKEDGMSSTRAWWVYWAVRLGGKDAADPRRGKKVETAP